MLFDAFGRPIDAPSPWVTPDWVNQWAATTFCQAPRAYPTTMYGPDNRPIASNPLHIGDTVTLRLPQRFRRG